MDREQHIQTIIEILAKCQRPALSSVRKASGLSHAQLGMLYLLFYHKQASVKETADYLGVTKSAVTQLADLLVDKGFVARRNDPQDRRIVRMSLTPAGAQELKKLAKHKFAGIRSAIDSLDDREIERLQGLLQKAIRGALVQPQKAKAEV
jgi:DNA-binding MarR family transcriptional regulator